MSILTHLKTMGFVAGFAIVHIFWNPHLEARGKNIDASVDRLMNSFNEYSKRTNGRMTAAERMEKRKEIIEPAHREMRREFFSVTKSALDHRGVRVNKSLEAARQNAALSKSNIKMDGDTGKLRLTRLDADGKPMGKGTVVGTRGGEPGKGSINPQLTGDKNSVGPGSGSDSEVIVSGEQDVKRLSFPGKKKTTDKK